MSRAKEGFAYFAGVCRRNSTRIAVAVTVGLVTCQSAFATGVVDPDVQTAIDNLGADWGVIKGAALAILGLMIAFALVKKGYRKLT